MAEIYLFPVVEPEYEVDSPAKYQKLMNFLADTTIEMAKEYPDKTILVTYLV